MIKNYNQQLKAYEDKKAQWIDDLLEKELNPISLWAVKLLGEKMAENKMNMFYRFFHVVFGLLYRLEVKEHQNAKFIEGKTKLMIDSMRVEVFLNKKFIGENTFTLSLILKK